MRNRVSISFATNLINSYKSKSKKKIIEIIFDRIIFIKFNCYI